MWTSVGDKTFCSVHKSTTDRGIPCAACVADPSATISDRDVSRLVEGKPLGYYEDKLIVIGELCMKLAADLISGERLTTCDRTEPIKLALNCMELAARTLGRGGEFAQRREATNEVNAMQKTLRDMQRPH